MGILLRSQEMALISRRRVTLTPARLVVFFMMTAAIGAASAAISAQDTFSITGYVKTDKGRAFPKAVVKADNLLGMTAAVFSQPDGRFVIRGLLPGSYQVSAEKSGYLKVSQTIVIPAAKPVSLVLKSAPADRHNKTNNQTHEAMNVTQ